MAAPSSAGPLRKRFQWFVVAALGLILLTFGLGVWGQYLWEGVAADAFNQQQLAVARSVARRIEDRCHFLKMHLALLARLPWNPSEAEPLSARPETGALPVLELAIIEPPSTKTVIGRDNVVTGAALTERDRECLRPTASIQGGFLGETHPAGTPESPGPRTLDLVQRVGETVWVWRLDATRIAREAAAGVRSGKTGYAWIIEKSGHFLAHHEQSFVGMDAFEVRSRRDPAISFDHINRLQKDFLLSGAEGTGRYVSGWHRDRAGPTKKLIAYTPVFYAGAEDREKYWSVAVAAPEDEAQAAIRWALVYQWALAAGTLAIIVAAAGYVLLQEIRYAKRLRREVAQKTQALQEAHGELLHAERLAAMGSAVAYVAHEIKNPLMVIGGFAHHLLRASERGAREKKELEIIAAETKRLEHLLKDIGRFAQDTPPARKPTDLRELLGEVVEFMGSQLEARGVSSRTDVPPEPVVARVDGEQIREVLLNVVKNALEATEGGGRVEIALRQTGDEALLRVADTGEGIPPDVLEKVFNPFFTTKREGSGLGLAICQKIVTGHQGTLHVESEPGRGTVVTIRLPTS